MEREGKGKRGREQLLIEYILLILRQFFPSLFESKGINEWKNCIRNLKGKVAIG